MPRNGWEEVSPCLACDEQPVGLSAEDVFDELFSLAPEKVGAVKEVRDLSPRSSGPDPPPPAWARPGGQRGEVGPWSTPAVCWVLWGRGGSVSP